MGTLFSTSKTSQFFIKSFGNNDRFIYQTYSGEKVLFIRREYDNNKIILIDGELLDKPDGSKSITYRNLKNCNCKSDLNDYEPSVSFLVHLYFDGFHDKVFINKEENFKEIIEEIEESVII